MAPGRERSRSPMGRNPLPVTVMNVKMCCAKCEEKAQEECEEVEGVVRVVTNQGENKVIVYGPADPSALLKKMRRHLDKHAMFWRVDGEDSSGIAPPLFPVDPSEILAQSRGAPPMETGRPISVDPRDGRPIVEARDVQQVDREILSGGEIRERGRQEEGPREVVFVPVDAKDGTPIDPRTVRKVDPPDGRPSVEIREVHPVLEREIKAASDPRVQSHGQGPREVVFVPVDAQDGTPVDPRSVRAIDPRDGRPIDPRDGGRPITPPHGRPVELREVRIDTRDGRPITPPQGRPVEFREIRPIDPRDGRPIDPRDGRPIDPRDGRPIDPREMRPVHPRDMRPLDPQGGRPIDVSDLRAIDPRVMRPMDPRDGQRMDPHVRSVDPRDVRRVDPRDIDPRDGRPNYGPARSEPHGGLRVPEGLVPIQTTPGSREMSFLPADPGGPQRSPTRGGDLRSLSPREAEYLSRNPRPSDYGPRSPREGDYGPPRGPDYGYGPRSPRAEGMDYNGPRSPRGGLEYGAPLQGAPARPVLDRELSFNDYGPGSGPRGGEVPRVPMPYEPLHARDAEAFDFHGGDNSREYSAPRSPRGSMGGNTEPMVRGYGDIDPRQLRPTEPRILLDVTKDLQGADLRDRNYDPRDYRRGLEPPRRQHNSQFSEFRKGEADLRDYQPREAYFSDYQPSQNYQPGPLATQELDELPITNPNYKKHISVAEY